MSGGTINNMPYVAVFFEKSFAIYRAVDGWTCYLQEHSSPTGVVFMDFVGEMLMIATNRTAECIDVERRVVISEYSVSEGRITDAVPTGVACEFILFVASANHTTNVLLFNGTRHVEVIHATTEDIVSKGIVMRDPTTVVVFLNGVTAGHNVHFRVPVPSNIVVGPVPFGNEFYTGDNRGGVRSYNSSGVVTRTFEFNERPNQAILGLAIGQDGATLVATVGNRVAAFNRKIGTRLWEHLIPEGTVGRMQPVHSSNINDWQRNADIFSNATMWFYDDGGDLYQLRIPQGEWSAKVSTYPRPPTRHAPAFATTAAGVEGECVAYQPYGVPFLCFIGIASARPQFCYEIEGANRSIAAVSLMNAVIATADGIILMPESMPLRSHDYDPTKARVGQERWAAKTGGQIEAMAYSDLAVCVLSRSAIFLYNPVNGKRLRDKEIPVEASYKAVRYFGVVGQGLVLVTDTCVMTVPLVGTTSSFAPTTALIDWAVPAGSGNDVLLFERNVGGANHNITYFKDGKGTTIFTTDELVVAAPIILHLEAEKKVVVVKEADHFVGVGLPQGKEVFRVGFKAVFGPVRIANRFFVGGDGGRVYEFAPGGTLIFTYRVSVAAQVRDIDASADGKIMVATVGLPGKAAFTVSVAPQY